jgi:hypothetical protein
MELLAFLALLCAGGWVLRIAGFFHSGLALAEL